jgi:hypothetical protein
MEDQTPRVRGGMRQDGVDLLNPQSSGSMLTDHDQVRRMRHVVVADQGEGR